MPRSRPRHSNKNKKNARHQTKAKQLRPIPQRRGGIKLQILYSLGFQLASVGLFTVFLSIGFYLLKERTEVAVWMFFLAFVSLAFAGALFVQERLLYEPETSGTLRPANDPDPPLPPGCIKAQPESIGIFYGGSVAFTPYEQITIIEVAGERLLWLNRTDKGRLSISAKIFSEDSRIVAEIADNNFTINPNNFFRRERPDKSTLVVYDQKNNQVLHVRYLNPLAIKVTGIFRYRNHFPVIVSENNLRVGGVTFTEVCTNGSGTVYSAQ